MGWKSKLAPMYRMVFDRNAGKRTAAEEACKSFEDSKDSYNTEFEEKKAEIQPKVLEIYEASSAEIKTFVKEPKEAGLKKSSTAVHSFLEQLVKMEFPGSQAACDASSKFGAAYVVDPILFVFEKVSTLVIREGNEAGTEVSPPMKTVATSGTEREIVIEEGAKEKEEQVEEKKEEAEELTEKTEEIAKEDKEKPIELATAAVAPTQEEEKLVEPATAAVAPTQVEEKFAQPATAAVPTQEEEKPSEPAIAAAPTQTKEDPAEPAVASSSADTSSIEPTKKSKEEKSAPATTDPVKV